MIQQMFKENAPEIQLKRKQTTSHKFREREKLILCSPSLDETLFPKPHQWSESHSHCLSKLLCSLALIVVPHHPSRRRHAQLGVISSSRSRTYQNISRNF